MDLLPLGEPEWVEDVFTQKFEMTDILKCLRIWKSSEKGKFYYEDGTVLTEDVLMKQAWDAHREKCDYHKDVKKRPKD